MNRREMLAASAAVTVCPWAWATEPPRDEREFKSIYESSFPLIVPRTLELWQQRAERIREQVLVATGLWPMPERTPLNAVVHSPIDRDTYTIAKVYFASRPGHYVTGNLYKPKASLSQPGVLFAHGHWAKGRFMEASDAEIKAALASKAEDTRESARYHMQAACAALAQRGYVVFQYDMVGYADSTAIGHVSKSGVPHPNGFADLDGELRLQSLMGLQTWNSLRAVDFLLSVEGIDAKRIGMTGASGGGTQTFSTAALDPRIGAAVPAVMVSTRMQGGCVCENCSLLRVGTGNVEIAALIAPRPLALTCADDWTKDVLTQGYPELQAVYALHGKRENVQAKAWPQYKHNYNQRAREFMETFFARHLEGKDEVVNEPAFVPVRPVELSVFDAKHPRPKDELNAAELRKTMTKTYACDSKALRAMLADEMPQRVALRHGPKETKVDGVTIHEAWFGRDDEKDAAPGLGMFGPKYDGSSAVMWVHPKGKASLTADGKLVPTARTLIDAGYAISVFDLFSPAKYPINPVYAGFTFGYNRSLLAERVHDLLTQMCFITTMLKPKNLRMIGWGKTGPEAAIALAANPKPFAKAVLDLQHFDFAGLKSVNDEMMLPGALKYGGLQGIMALIAPTPLAVFNVPKNLKLEQSVKLDEKPITDAAAVALLLK